MHVCYLKSNYLVVIDRPPLSHGEAQQLRGWTSSLFSNTSALEPVISVDISGGFMYGRMGKSFEKLAGQLSIIFPWSWDSIHPRLLNFDVSISRVIIKISFWNNVSFIGLTSELDEFCSTNGSSQDALILDQNQSPNPLV